MSLRDRQRAYYYDRLTKVLYDLCGQLGIATQIPQYSPQQAKQLDLF